MNRIIVFTVYFGRLPSFFYYWLLSASKNKTIDFVVFTDDELSIETYKNFCDNVTFVFFNLENAKEKLSLITGFSVSLDNPYKMCDYKPFYGLLFSEYIKGYNFWGYCDIDLIFGEIRKFVTDERLNCNDRIFELGHFCLYRNSIDNNSFFKTIDKSLSYFTYLDAAQKKYNVYFDEYDGINVLWNALKKDKQFIDDEIVFDIDIFHAPMFKTNRCKISKRPYFFIWKDGILTASNGISEKEIVYVHLQKRKIKVIGNISIDNQTFYLFNEFLFNSMSKEEVAKKYNKAKNNFLYNLIYWIWHKYIFYLHKIKRKITINKNKDNNSWRKQT